MRLIRNIWLALAVFSLTLGQASAAQSASQEDNVRAAILLNLARFSDWSIRPSGNEKFKICSLTTPEMQKALNNLSGKPFNNGLLDVVTAHRLDDISNDCRIVYFSETNGLADLDLIKLAERGIVTIGQESDFVDRGGAIQIERHKKQTGIFHQ